MSFSVSILDHFNTHLILEQKALYKLSSYYLLLTLNETANLILIIVTVLHELDSFDFETYLLDVLYIIGPEL